MNAELFLRVCRVCRAMNRSAKCAAVVFTVNAHLFGENCARGLRTGAQKYLLNLAEYVMKKKNENQF